MKTNAKTKYTTKLKRPAPRKSVSRVGAKRPGRRSTSYVTLPLYKLVRLDLAALGLQRSVALAGAVCLAAMLLALFVMPDYAIQVIEVKGNQSTPTEDVQAAIGFARGYNAFLLRSRDVVDAVMAVSGVEYVDAQVTLPGRLQVAIKDVRPEVLWLAGSQALWVDSKGLVLDHPPVEPERKLTIKDVSGRVYRRGDSVDKAALAGAQRLGVLMPREIQGFEFQRDGELIVISTQGWRAQFSTRDEMEPQLNALRRTLSGVPGVTFVDVRVPSVISYNR